eukprot:Skav205140  [mRNA]  locus=scaffold3411:223963:226789:- [translate_table: standard]
MAAAPSTKLRAARWMSTGSIERVEEVKTWVDEVILRHGFCPWAQTSAKQDLIRYLDCTGATKQQVATQLRAEAHRLVSAVPLTTALVICDVPEARRKTCPTTGLEDRPEICEMILWRSSR